MYNGQLLRSPTLRLEGLSWGKPSCVTEAELIDKIARSSVAPVMQRGQQCPQSLARSLAPTELSHLVDGSDALSVGLLLSQEFSGVGINVIGMLVVQHLPLRASLAFSRLMLIPNLFVLRPFLTASAMALSLSTVNSPTTTFL